MKLKRPLRGEEQGVDVRMVQRALNRWTKVAEGIPVTSVYDRTTSDRMMAFQAGHGISPASGFMGQKTLDALEQFFDAYGRMRYLGTRPPKTMPELGPFVQGSKSVLEQDLTHATGGLPGYPAFDDGWVAGAQIVAPEPLVPWRESSARRRDGSPNGKAFYARGKSAIDYWIAHTDSIPPITLRARLSKGRLGTKLPKGMVLARISANHEAPHGHFGVNAKGLIGYELEHRTDYRHGAATVGEQFRKALS